MSVLLAITPLPLNVPAGMLKVGFFAAVMVILRLALRVTVGAAIPGSSNKVELPIVTLVEAVPGTAPRERSLSMTKVVLSASVEATKVFTTEPGAVVGRSVTPLLLLFHAIAPVVPATLPMMMRLRVPSEYKAGVAEALIVPRS